MSDGERFAIAIGAVSADRAERQALILVRLMLGCDIGSLMVESLLMLGPARFDDEGDGIKDQAQRFYADQRKLGRRTFHPEQLTAKVFPRQERTSGFPA